MGAMKRVFSIEDELNPRYMPSTREMSPIVHRKIWKWLYFELYNNKTISPGFQVPIIMEKMVVTGVGAAMASSRVDVRQLKK